MLCRAARPAPRPAARSTTSARPAPARRGYAVGQDVTQFGEKLRDADGNVVTAKDVFKGKKVVLMGVPGAFTPVCTNKHLPSYAENMAAFKEHKVDTIACLSVNDHYVLKAWAEKMGVGKKIVLLADPEAAFTKFLGLDINLGGAGLGVRAKRFTQLVDDGKVTFETVEKSPADFELCKPDHVKAFLKGLKAPPKK